MVTAVFGHPDKARKRSIDGAGNETRFSALSSMVHLHQRDAHILIDKTSLRKLRYTGSSRMSDTLSCATLPNNQRWVALARGTGDSVYGVQGKVDSATSAIFKIHVQLEEFDGCLLEQLVGSTHVHPLANLYATNLAINDTVIVLGDSFKHQLRLVNTEEKHQLDYYVSSSEVPGEYKEEIKLHHKQVSLTY
ncbi:uncharacterized protein [Watersipora subatra]|uniref:uncharacterized protein isoform X2 n=1 Tax=Watersipora subatra TaxID=2589382 RepID=UPI00355BB68A